MTERVEPIGIGEEETKERDGAFPRLDEAQRERLRKMGRAREVEAGEVLFRAGDETTDFFVVESGAVTIVQGLGEENRVIAQACLKRNGVTHCRKTAQNLSQGASSAETSPSSAMPPNRPNSSEHFALLP